MKCAYCSCLDNKNKKEGCASGSSESLSAEDKK